MYDDLEISLIQAALGDKIPVQTVSGMYKMVVPQGITNGQQIVINNMGMPNPYKFGNKRGNFIITVNVKTPTNISPELIKTMKTYSLVESKSEKNYE